MSDIEDSEFGVISVRTNNRSRNIRIRVGVDGRYVLSAPKYTPAFIIKRFINGSREQIRTLGKTQQPEVIYLHGSQIGKSHTLLVKEMPLAMPKIDIDGQQVILQLPNDTPIESADVQRLLRDTVIKLLRTEAKRYLPRRLKFLAEKGGYNYQRVRFTHASSRWGSCSSTGTISLNIALMKLPFELLDYVLIHELSHTVHMNHSEQFWQEVAHLDPHYRTHRQALKRETPMI